MKRVTLVGTLLICTAAVVAAVLLFSRPVEKSKKVPPYNPYPPGILPSNLVSEIARVRREVASIENEALAQWRALPPPTLSNTQGTGNPSTLQGTGYQAVQTLGKLLNFDENMSPFRNQACAFCHMPYAAFSGPIPSVNLTMIAYPGTAEFRAAKRSAQRYTYSPKFPVLQLLFGRFIGGNFWDSRSTGYLLQSPDAEQAQHPPVDTQEMGFPDTACIAFRLSQAVYRPLFELVWGLDFDIDFPANTEKICSTPGGNFPTATPVGLSPEDRTRANNIYNHWGQSISFYEDSPAVSPFSSKFDAFLQAGTYTLTPDERAGYELFRGKGNCNSCHLDGASTLLKPGQTDTGIPVKASQPLFTNFANTNLGLPLNPRVALFYQTKPDPFGFTPNPFGFGYRDLGFGTFLRSGFGSAPNPNSTWTQFAPTKDGNMQVSTARNVAMTPPQCPTTEAGQTDAKGNPIPYFQKEFFHNGYIKSLKQLVHFYNTRDKYAYNVTSGHCPPGTVERVTCWPMPEVRNNVNMTVGNLGLSDHEENLIVTFMLTLTDGFTTPYPDSNTFTGQCMTGGNASTQGNEFLIPTPPLPPCTSAICGVPPLPSPPIRAAAGGLLSSNPMPAQASPSTQKAARIRITQGPELELAKEHLIIIRWTTNTPGGSPVHYGIVYYGTDPKNLSQTAKSPIELNPDHSATIFRVRLDGLKPRTTYYYTVGSMEANGTDDRKKSTVKQFTTP